MPNYFGYLLVFVDAGENLVMANDVTTPSNPQVAPIKKEKLKEASLDETLLDMNVSQRSCKEEPLKRVVHTQVNRSAWDHRLFLNPRALTIYLQFVPARGTAPKRFEECQCEDDNIVEFA